MAVAYFQAGLKPIGHIAHASDDTELVSEHSHSTQSWRRGCVVYLEGTMTPWLLLQGVF